MDERERMIYRLLYHCRILVGKLPPTAENLALSNNIISALFVAGGKFNDYEKDDIMNCGESLTAVERQLKEGK